MRVPVDMVVGEENKGWDLITNQLNHERVTLGPAGQPRSGVRPLPTPGPAARGWRTSRTYDGRSARSGPAFRINELLNWQVAANMDLGWLGAPDASATKVFASERMQELGRLIGDILAGTATRPTRRRPS